MHLSRSLSRCQHALAFLQASILCSLIFGMVSGIAPGDETCTLQSHASDVDVLMDSYNYQNLPWFPLDLDGNGITWTIAAGGLCQRTYSSDASASNANDWLITQLISKNVSSSVNTYPFNVSLVVTVRSTISSCTKLLSVYKYAVNTPSNAVYSDTSRYSIIGNITASSSGVTYNLSFAVQPGEDYFYIAFRSRPGSCLSLTRVVVYRSSVQSKTVGLLSYPEVPIPLSGSATVLGTCSLYSSALTGNAPKLVISSQGQWLSSDQCYCLPGYQYDTNSNLCTVCGAGKFKSTLSNNETCQTCPLNSMSSQSGAAVCPCNSGYLRPALQPAQDCIQSPSSPQVSFSNSLSVTATSITPCWLPPSNAGGRPESLFYNLYIQKIGTQSNECLTKVKSSYSVTTGPFCLTISSLNSSLYAVYVVAANAATEDPDTVCNVTVINSRYLAIVAQTACNSSAESSTSAAIIITFFVTFAAVMAAGH